MTRLAYYQWGQLGNMRNVPPLAWGVPVGRNLFMRKTPRESLSGGIGVDLASYLKYMEWTLSWDFLSEIQAGDVMSSYASSVPFYFIDASHGNHFPASNIWVTTTPSTPSGITGYSPSTFVGPNGRSEAWAQSASAVYRMSRLIPVKGGQQITVGFSHRLSSGTTSSSTSLFLDWLDIAGQQITPATTSSSSTSSATTWTNFRQTFTVPSDGATVSLRLALRANTNAQVYADPLVRILEYCHLSASDSWVPPGGSAKVVIADQPNFATISPTMRSASIRIREVA